jgi:hypothetical protein
MPDKKLTDNEIVKALECCARPLPHCYCDECPAGANGGCAMKTENIIDLINRLQAENEKKDRAFENLIEVARLWKEKYNNAKKELFNKTEQLKTAKAEAYKEFAERLKNVPVRFHIEHDGLDKFVPFIDDIDIDNLLKELVGEDNDR